MTKYHVNPRTGNIYPCTARPGNCPYSEEYHAESKQDAQKIADEINQKILQEGELAIERKQNELFIRMKMDKKLRKANARLKNNANRAKKEAQAKYKESKKHGNKQSLRSYIQYRMDNDKKLQEAIAYKQFILNMSNMYIDHREQAKELESNIGDIFKSKSYSCASSSTYYIIDKSNVNKLETYLKDNGYEYDIDIEGANNFVDIRMADHTNNSDTTGFAINIKYKTNNTTRTEEDIVELYEKYKDKEEV